MHIKGCVWMAKRYFEAKRQELKIKYDLDIVDDILLGKKDRLLAYADVSNIHDIELRLIHNSFELIGLEQKPSYQLKSILEMMDFDNRYADVSGKETYKQYVYNEVYNFKSEVDLSFPIMTQTGRRWIRYSSFPIEKHKHIIAMFISDITPLLNQEEALYDKVHRDPLTQLFNKYNFDYHYGKRYLLEDIHVLYMDLDDFKQINDLYGHHIGNQYLVAFSEILKSYESELNHFYRLGGDEFVGLFFEKPERVKQIAQEIIDQTCALTIGNIKERVTISIGIIKGTSRIDLARKADDILYKVKSKGKNHYLYEVES